jgi:putative ABC transport system permease protein
MIGRLKLGVSLEGARAELDTISGPISSMFLKATGFKKSVVLSAWHEEIISKAKLSLLLFLGAVSLLLLMACVNVANLLLSRAATRQKEIAVRLAVGAGRMRIIQQLLTESTLLALAGGLIGLALARWGKDLLVAFISADLPRLGPIGLDWHVLGFNLGLAALTGVAFGLAPAFQATSVSLNEVLKEAGRTAGELRSGLLLRNALTAGETALAMVLLVGAGLLFRSFLRVRGIDPGYRTKNILSATVDLTPSKYPTPRDQSRFFQQLSEKIKGLEGVESVGLTSSAPLGGGYLTGVGEVRIEGRVEPAPSAVEKLPNNFYAMISSDYFRTMGIPLIGGRYFTDADREGSPGVIILTESFARRYFPGENCLGRRIMNWLQKNDWLTVVGVVGDVRSGEGGASPAMYLPYLQVGSPHMTFLVRTAGDPMRWAGALRSQVASMDEDQPPHDLARLDELRAGSFTSRRVNMLLLGSFATLGLILASVGIYGVVSYSVSQRTHEIGVRMALGAARSDLLKLVIGQGLGSAIIGAGIGTAASLALTRLLQTMLFGVKPTDPATFFLVGLLIVGVALLASYVPARRASKVDPIVALRYE